MTFALMTPNQKMLTAEEESAIIQEWIVGRDNKVLEKLLKAFAPLVAKFARKFSFYGIPRDDLLSVGHLALVETAHRFKPELNLRFSTYASHWIKGTMLIYIASNYFTFSLKSQKLKKIFFSLRRVLYTEQQQNIVDFDVVMEKMAGEFGVSRTKLDEMYAMICSPSTSFDQPVGSSSDGGDTICFGDLLTDTDAVDPETTLVDDRLDRFRKELIYEAMSDLKDRERIIIIGQMLMEDGHEKTLQDLAEEFGCSRERVRQIRNTAFEKLETAIRLRCQHIDTDDLWS